MEKVGIRELRQNLSKYVDRVRAGDQFDVTDRGRVVARLVPAGTEADAAYGLVAARLGATIPTVRLEDAARRISGRAGAPAGTTDTFLAESRADRRGR